MPTDPENRHTRLRPHRVRRAVFLLPLLAVSLTGCDQRFGFPNPATEQGDEVLSLWLVCLYAATALGVLVLGLLFYSMIRHRRRDDTLPKQTEGSVPWEITYTVIPFIIVGLLFGYGIKVQNTQTDLKRPDVEITVTGYQWNWRFEYHAPGAPPESAPIVTVSGSPTHEPEMWLPEDERIRFNLVAADVNHAFFVPRFVTKRDLIPGVRNEIDVTPKHTGDYVGHCAEYCGLNHSQMNFRVRVVSRTDYDRWVGEQMEKQQHSAAGDAASHGTGA